MLPVAAFILCATGTKTGSTQGTQDRHTVNRETERKGVNRRTDRQ